MSCLFQTKMKDMEIILIYTGDPRRQKEKPQFQETKGPQVMGSEINSCLKGGPGLVNAAACHHNMCAVNIVAFCFVRSSHCSLGSHGVGTYFLDGPLAVFFSHMPK